MKAFPNTRTERVLRREMGGQTQVWVDQEVKDSGMDLRDYFAAKAMQAILSDVTYGETYKHLAAHAYGVADAMLKERSNETKAS